MSRTASLSFSSQHVLHLLSPFAFSFSPSFLHSRSSLVSFLSPFFPLPHFFMKDTEGERDCCAGRGFSYTSVQPFPAVWKDWSLFLCVCMRTLRGARVLGRWAATGWQWRVIVVTTGVSTVPQWTFPIFFIFFLFFFFYFLSTDTSTNQPAAAVLGSGQIGGLTEAFSPGRDWVRVWVRGQGCFGVWGEG